MGEFKHDGLAVPGRVELAHEPSFALGTLRIDPPTRQVIGAIDQQTLEPKVMQVLVALARANGAVVSRDELIDWCWDGRIVGDDALNRVIGRIRQLGAGPGGGSFAVETITKVGYRLTSVTPETSAYRSPATPSSPHSGSIGRRTVLVGAGGAAAVGALGWIWLQRREYQPAPEAADLLRRAEIAWKSGLDDQARQSVSYLERAVRIDPGFAAAWGALASAYTHFLEGYGEAEMASVPGRIRAAAERALELDPDNGDARLALACIPPNFRNWQTAEVQLRALTERYPDLWLAHGRLAFVLYQVGRFENGIRSHRRLLEIDPMIPVPYIAIARAHANRGQIQAADAVLDEALAKWPAHPLIWNARFFHQLFAGRPQAAAANIRNPDHRPSGIPQQRIDDMLQLAMAVDTRREADVAPVVDKFRQAAAADIGFTPIAAPLFALFGLIDLSFACLDRYYFNRGDFGEPAAIGPYTRRHTDFLFGEPMRALRADVRFAGLLDSIGLSAYWQATASRPDFQRP